MQNDKIEIKCLEVIQPIGKFYIGVIPFHQFLAISYIDIRHMVKRETELETYMGIQRTLDTGRVNKIKKYLEGIDATFPTSMIIAISSKDAEFDSQNCIMRIANKQDVAKILDGQHRIKGLEDFKKNGEKFQLNTTIFIDVELEEQALIFATINQSQTKVNNSLVADLYEFATVRSPQKTAHNICKALNEKNDSPFKDKIKILGTADDKEKETITQATFVDNIIKYISPDKVRDRNIYKSNNTPPKSRGEELNRYFFRNLFIEEKDADIAKIIFNYFTAVKLKWEEFWTEPKQNIVLNRSTGFIALMNFLKPAYLHLVKDNIGEVPSLQKFVSIFDSINLPGSEINKNIYKPGGSGISALTNDLKQKSKLL